MSDFGFDWQEILEENGLPSDLEAEKAILGSTQLNNRLAEQIADLLDENDFYLEPNRLIFRSICSLVEKGTRIDAITIGDVLRAQGSFERVGGITYIASLTDGIPRTDSIEPYARILRQKAKERQLIATLNTSLGRIVAGEDREAIIADIKQFCVREIESNNKTFMGFYNSLDDFFNGKIIKLEEIIHGIHRGEVGELAAVTNYGKSTLLLNLALSLASGEECLPLFPHATTIRCVIYVDGENSPSRLRSDLLTMLHQVTNYELARENLKLVIDGHIDGFPLNLSKSQHLNRLIAFGQKHKADLIVIDPVGSIFELYNENDNAEVTRRIMNPLKTLAREVDCAVIFSHHIGKSAETQTGEGAYKGRGGSAFGALSRVVFTIEKDQKHGANYIVLKCAKSKGAIFDPVLMKLNQETRWFEPCAEKPIEPAKPPTAQEIAAFVAASIEVSTQEIKKHFAGRGSVRTISDRIQNAQRAGLIFKANQKAPWRFGTSKK